jgi:hypothetical protein
MGFETIAIIILIVLWKSETAWRREAEEKLTALQDVIETVREGLE